MIQEQANYALGQTFMAVTQKQIHVEQLPGGFLLNVIGPGAPYTKQIIVTADELAEFIRAWGKA